MTLHSSVHPNCEMCATPCYSNIYCGHCNSELGNATLCACCGKLNMTVQLKVKLTSYRGNLLFVNETYLS